MTDLLIKISQLESSFLVDVPDLDRVKQFGLVRQFYDAKLGRIGLQTISAEEPCRVALDTQSFDVHLAHRPVQFVPTGQVQWGSLMDPVGDLKVNLLVTTNRPGLAAAIVRSVQTLSYLRFDGVELDVMNALSGEWKLDVNSVQGLDPGLSAFVIRYALRGVDVTNFLTDF